MLTSPTTPIYALDNFYAMTPFPEVARTLLHNVFLNDEINKDPVALSIDLVTADCFVDLRQKDASRFVDEVNIHGHVVALVLSRAAVIEDKDQKWALLDSCAPFLKWVLVGFLTYAG